MRIGADSNVVVSAFLWGGTPNAILYAARAQRITLYTSAPLIAELEDVLSRAKLAQRFAAIHSTPAALLDRYLALARFVTPAILANPIARDPDDDQVIATAITARADLIVSGDRDLLDLGDFQNIRIISAAVAVGEIETLRASAP